MSFFNSPSASYVLEAMPDVFAPLAGIKDHASTEAVSKTSENFEAALKNLATHVDSDAGLKEKFVAVADAHQKVRAHEVLKDGKWTLKEGLDEAAKTAYNEAKTALENAKKPVLDALKVTDTSPDVVKKFAEAQTDAQKFKNVGVLTGGLRSGKVHALGFGGALKDNLLNGDKKLISGARIAGVGAGIYVASRGVKQLFTSEEAARAKGEEPPSKLLAIGKVVVGLGGAGLAALGGAAR